MKLSDLLAQVITEQQVNLPKGDVSSGTFDSVLKLVFGIAGGVAVLIITIAGFKYVISQGDPQATAKAKNTIMYALIGLAICIFAFTIVNFIIPKL